MIPKGGKQIRNETKSQDHIPRPKRHIYQTREGGKVKTVDKPKPLLRAELMSRQENKSKFHVEKKP